MKIPQNPWIKKKWPKEQSKNSVKIILPNAHSFFNISWCDRISQIDHKFSELFNIYYVFWIIWIGIDDLCTTGDLWWSKRKLVKIALNHVISILLLIFGSWIALRTCINWAEWSIKIRSTANSSTYVLTNFVVLILI